MKTMLSWYSIPAIILYLWIIFEAVRIYAARKKGQGNSICLRVAGWVIRPWTVWAVFNLFYRMNASRGFNNIRTFPFYANLWHEKTPLGSVIRQYVSSPVVWIWLCIAVVLGAALIILISAILKRDRFPIGLKAGSMLLVVLLVIGLWLSIASLPEGPVPHEKNPGSLLWTWYTGGGTMLYAMPLIKSPAHFVANYADLHPRLRPTIHGYSHPPGAPLSLYWLGEFFGAGSDVRAAETKIRYLLGVTLFGSLNICMILLLAYSLFGDWKTGCVAAVFWAVSPAAVAYATFSHDVVYAVFFNAALIMSWQIATRAGIQWKYIVLMGAVLFCLTMLNYSWCLVAAVFSMFGLICGIKNKWPFREYVMRLGVPLFIMTVFLGGILIFYHLNYLRHYLDASAYVREWYEFTGPYQWIMALIGGQIDIWLMMGPVVASLFALQLGRLVRWREWEKQDLFLLVILGVYALPLLFGPNPLKMETSRCWIWVTSVPFAFCARAVMRMKNPRKLIMGICIISLLTSVIMRLFMNFGC